MNSLHFNVLNVIGCGVFGSYTGEGSDMDGKYDTQVSQKDSGTVGKQSKVSMDGVVRNK